MSKKAIIIRNYRNKCNISVISDMIQWYVKIYVLFIIGDLLTFGDPDVTLICILHISLNRTVYYLHFEWSFVTIGYSVTK